MTAVAASSYCSAELAYLQYFIACANASGGTTEAAVWPLLPPPPLLLLLPMVMPASLLLAAAAAGFAGWVSGGWIDG